MAKKKAIVEHAKDAARFHTDLNIFYGIIALLEGGLVSSDSYPAAERIIEICKREGARSLAKYDRSLAQTSNK